MGRNASLLREFFPSLVLVVFFRLEQAVTGQIVLNTWNFQGANAEAYRVIQTNDSLDSLVAGLTWCEDHQCDGTVGPGGSPNENGDVTLDSMLMDADTRNVGAVASMYNISHAARVARRVLEDTYHSLLVGADATAFALREGFQLATLRTERTDAKWAAWVAGGRVPNHWVAGAPGEVEGHDTIGMIARDGAGRLVCGTSTNGLTWRVPGRVGDSPLPGAGAYCEAGGGACVATGDGDVILRFAPCARAVWAMRRLDLGPQAACEAALEDLAALYPEAMAGVVCLGPDGRAHGGAKTRGNFAYCVSSPETDGAVEVVHVSERVGAAADLGGEGGEAGEVAAAGR